MLIRGLPVGVIWLYDFFAFLALFYLCWRYRRNYVAILIIMLFFAGLFADMGKTVQNIYKIIMLGAALYIPIKYAINREIRRVRFAWLALAVFVCFVSFVCIFIHKDSVTLVFAQMFKYIVPAAMLPLIVKWSRNAESCSFLDLLFGRILVIQIALNVIKLILVGNWFEGLVGSITGITGGGVGTSLPLLGLCWFALNSNMRIQDKKSVLFIAGLLFIGFMTGKRAVWLLFPVLFLLLGTLVAKRRYFRQPRYIIIVIPVLLYLGLRLTPSFNPEQRLWGSFDPTYAWNYAIEYSMGQEDTANAQGQGQGQGRIGSNILIWNRIISPATYHTSEGLFGLGAGYIFAADTEQYRNDEYYKGINHRGSLTGFSMFYLAFGLIGLLLFVLYWVCVIRIIHYTRARWVIGGMLLFDFIFYNATIVQTPALAVLFMFIAVYTNVVYTKRGEHLDLPNALGRIRARGNIIPVTQPHGQNP